jgi:hypothetical protein
MLVNMENFIKKTCIFVSHVLLIPITSSRSHQTELNNVEQILLMKKEAQQINSNFKTKDTRRTYT